MFAHLEEKLLTAEIAEIKNEIAENGFNRRDRREKDEIAEKFFAE
jgi:hypothetical protein